MLAAFIMAPPPWPLESSSICVKLGTEAIQCSLDIDRHDHVKLGVSDVSDCAALLGNAGPGDPSQIESTCYRLTEVCRSVSDPRRTGFLRAHVDYSCENRQEGKRPLELVLDGLESCRIEFSRENRVEWLASNMAVARPMPDSAPVIKTTFP